MRSPGVIVSILTLWTVVSCGDGTDPSDEETTPTTSGTGTGSDAPDSDTEDSVAYSVWRDPATGLAWMDPSAAHGLSFAEANEYCAELVLNDNEEWRLPTIEELRSIVMGCAETEAGGECDVVDGVGSGAVGMECTGCEKYQGPDPDEGCYWDPELSGLCMYYWSASVDADVSGNAWAVFFVEGGITSQMDTLIFQVRCVSGPG